MTGLHDSQKASVVGPLQCSKLEDRVPSLAEALDALRDAPGFRIDEELVDQVLERAGETPAEER